MTTNGENQASTPAAGPTAASAAGSRGGVSGVAALAVVIVIALLDAVVETVWGGSPIRWWVAGPVALFVALVAWLWRPGGAVLRRTRPGSAAGLLLAGLLALLAATAWSPGGQVNGVRMLGQPTPVVLAGALAALVALATYVIIRSVGFVPAKPRLIVQFVFALIGLYALASFGLAIKDHLDFVALFQGGALWQRLPRWLQGSFVGALVVTPIAVLAQFARIGGHVRSGQPVRVLIHQAVALVMAFVMALSGVVLPGGSAAPAMGAGGGPSGPKPPDVPTLTLAEIEQGHKELFGGQDPVTLGENFVRAAEQELNKPGADPSDIAARAAALGRDPLKIFAFMRDQVALEPYSGVLRGARGTLAAGAGNALDRALLAQALLEASGIESRLVAGRLSTSLADALLARFFTAGTPSALPARGIRKTEDAVFDASVRDVAVKAGVAPDALAAAMHRAAQRSDSFMWKAEEQRAIQFDFLSRALRRGGDRPSADRDAVLNELRGRLKEHYWLQTKDASGNWSEFDPSMPAAKPGTAVGSEPEVLPAIPTDRFHRFQLQLVYRTESGGEVKPEVLVDRTVPSAEALFTPMEFRIQPGESIPSANAMGKMNAVQRAEMLRGIRKFLPIVRLGSKTIGGRAFDLEGKVFDAGTGDPMGAASGLMGGMLGFGGESEPVTFVDLQLVLRMTGPGREPMTQTRTLVNAADTKTASFAPPIGEWQVLVQPQWISTDLAGFQILSHLTDLARSMTAQMKARKGFGGMELPPPVPVQLLELTLARESATSGILARQAGLRAFIDAPLLTISGHTLSALLPEEGRIVAARTIDIVDNAVRFVATDARSQAAAFDAALAQGAADCTLEQQVLQEAFPDYATTSGVTIMQRAQLERRALVFAGPRDANTLKAAGLVDADVQWIGANEPAQAQLLVAKAAEGPAAWWSVRPEGTAVLRVSGGQGQAQAEHQIDIGLVALKILAGLVCAVEIAEAVSHGGGGALGVFTIAWCIAATTGSAVMFFALFHTASYVLLGAELVIFLGKQGYETWGHGGGE